MASAGAMAMPDGTSPRHAVTNAKFVPRLTPVAFSASESSAISAAAPAAAPEARRRLR